MTFELVAVNLDQKQPGFPDARAAGLPRGASASPFHIIEQDTYSDRQARDPRGQDDLRAVLAAAARHPLPLRRRASASTKIALGHHRDDILETLFLNLFFGGKLKAMPPKLRQRRRPATS
ncbi:MAG: hypothetical protein MZU95_17245 [Desulfomicrobium escambiense]|nr:hypothetical protein [Desulfomicrobium escambiense]